MTCRPGRRFLLLHALAPGRPGPADPGTPALPGAGECPPIRGSVPRDHRHPVRACGRPVSPKTTTGLDGNKKVSRIKRGLAVDVLGLVIGVVVPPASAHARPSRKPSTSTPARHSRPENCTNSAICPPRKRPSTSPEAASHASSGKASSPNPDEASTRNGLNVHSEHQAGANWDSAGYGTTAAYDPCAEEASALAASRPYRGHASAGSGGPLWDGARSGAGRSGVGNWREGFQGDVEDEACVVGAALQPPGAHRGDVVGDLFDRALDAGGAGVGRGWLQVSVEVGGFADELVRAANSTRIRPGCGSSVSQQTAVAGSSQPSPSPSFVPMAAHYPSGGVRHDRLSGTSRSTATGWVVGSMISCALVSVGTPE
ncbi:hypothetical protein QF037_010228 [Streptomyces canus]|nr:hypothetical protein [Streptomyces canus]